MNVKKTLPVIFSIAGSLGVIGTSILAVLCSKKYKDEPNEDNKKAKVKKFFKCYWPSILSGMATVGSITAGTVISKKTEASLSAAVIMLERGYNKYQNKVKSMLGVDTHNSIMKEIAKEETEKLGLSSSLKDGRKLYYNNYLGHFYAKPEDVTRAILNMNMRLHSCSVNNDIPWNEKQICTLKQFVEESKAELLDETIYRTYKDYGWTYEYMSDVMDDDWIYDGYCDGDKLNGEDVTVLTFATIEPIYIPGGWNHEEYLGTRSEQWRDRYLYDVQSDEYSDGGLPPWDMDTNNIGE